MDLILGAICFRLNDKHKVKDPETNRRGKRTRLKEQLYKHINSRIRGLKPGFNIGESTATIIPSDKWDYPYMHWSFKPTSSVRDVTKSKGYKNSPHTSTEWATVKRSLSMYQGLYISCAKEHIFSQIRKKSLFIFCDFNILIIKNALCYDKLRKARECTSGQKPAGIPSYSTPGSLPSIFDQSFFLPCSAPPA